MLTCQSEPMNFPLSVSLSKEMDDGRRQKKISELGGNRRNPRPPALIVCCSTDLAMRPDESKACVCYGGNCGNATVKDTKEICTANTKEKVLVRKWEIARVPRAQ